jgi:AcrR family transcriptional regulator
MPTASATVADARVPTRERVLYASAELFRRQGYAGTGLKQIAAESDATLGSVYHFFPGGKEHLADEVLRAGGRFFLALYEAIADGAPDLMSAVRDFFDGAGQTLVATDFADACPIATVAGEIASTHELLRVATADVFESWLGALVEDAVEAGVAADRARPLRRPRAPARAQRARRARGGVPAQPLAAERRADDGCVGRGGRARRRRPGRQ